MTLQITSGSLRLPCYITLIKNMAHNTDLDDTTHDKTRHDSAGTFELLLVCMSSYKVVRWWMSSWCVTASPLHGKVCEVFDGHWVHLMLHSHVAPCLYVCMLDRFVHFQKVYVHLSIHSQTHLHMFIHPYICKHIFTWSSIWKQVYLHASFAHSFTNIPFFLYSPCSSHTSSCHVYSCTCICSHSWQDDIKSINLLVYHDAWSFRM